MKKIVGFVQPNFPQGPKELNAYYLPYSVGVVWSYALTKKFVRDGFELGPIIFKRDNIGDTVEKLKSCSVVGFSTYIWNRNYNYELAKRLKLVNPECIVVFGGPEPEVTDLEIFGYRPYIDILVKQEGESTFTEILDCIGSNRPLDTIMGVVVNKNGQAEDTGPGIRINNLENVPSPYLTGLFDRVMKENPDIEWNATLETNRGCPYQCTFCDWGSLTYNKVKKFDLSRVIEELEWFGRNRCGFLSIADANFGIFPERDDEIVERLIEVQQKYGYPYRINVAWAKNQKTEVVKIAKKLMSAVFNNGLTLSVQSLDDTVLENIKRKNLEINKLGEVFELCASANVPVNTELILGLPGETVESWRKNFYRLYEIGQHNGIEVFQAQILENAEMNLTQRKEFNIGTIEVDDYMSGSYASDDIKETVEVVVSTNTLEHEKMLECQLFSWFMNTFHISGFTQLYSRFVNKHLNVSYEDFYNDLFDYIQTVPWASSEYEEIKSLYSNWMKTGKISGPKFGTVEIHGWNLIHKTVLSIHSNAMHELVNASLRNFFMSRFGARINEKLLADIIQMQENYVIQHKIRSYPLSIRLSHNIDEYLLGQNLVNTETEYLFDFPEDKEQSIEVFLQNIYFSRRRNFGKALVIR